MQAFLVGAIRPEGKLLPTYRRQIVAATAAEQKRAQETNAQVDAALQALDKKAQELNKALPDIKQRQEALAKERAEQERKRIVLSEIRALYDQDAVPPPTRILLRGEYIHPGAMVEPGIPSILEDYKRSLVLPAVAPNAPTTGRRRALAEWIARSDNPLTARVMVNRVWSYHFGVGIVPTLDNFGRSGQAPSHPALLDWLSVHFAQGIERGKPWSLKALHRLILSSRAYRQSSAANAQATKIDPENRLLWRQRTRRLEAEAIRDSLLAVAGNLDSAMYGAPVDNEARGTGEIVAPGEEKGGRRSLYLLVRRSMPVTLLNVFDAPVMETNCTRRVVSTTPGQALTLLNSSFMEAQSKRFALRLMQEVSATGMSEYEARKARIAHAIRLAFNRDPSAKEMQTLLGFVQAQTLRYQKPKEEQEAEQSAFADMCLALLSSNEFVYVD
jgi:hypothetical protein